MNKSFIKIILSAGLLAFAGTASALSLNEEFIQVCTNGDESAAVRLLDEGANIEARDGCDHQTALVFAADRGHLPIVRLLVSRGADINAQDDKGWTALSEASYMGHPKVVGFLLESKASTLPSTSWLDSRRNGNALFWCIASTHNTYTDKVAVTKLLLENDAEPEGTDEQNRDSLAIAKANNYKEIVELLERFRRERMAKLDEYALLEAIRAQDTEKARKYIERGANPNALLPNGESVLNHAVSTQSYAIVRLFLDSGANPNTQNALGTSALMTAVRLGNSSIVNLLLSHGVNMEQADMSGKTALFYAVENKNSSILASLIRNGANRDAADNDGRTVFLYACLKDNISACRTLIANGCDVSVPDIFGNTAIIAAAQKNSAELVRLILRQDRYAAEAEDSEGNNAAYYAEKNGNRQILQILENK